mmetsp:Transcript_119057/g.333542  ORF Transcript_119057/g.333542 Transcript_119057/m.333542 type:complete len:340 (+) Transcript_119057:231-1250(+)
MVNKLFIMLPAMFAARKLDSEDPMQVFWLRVAYGTIQAVCVLIVAYTYIQATTIASKSTGGVIYVPPAPQPFADPNAKKKYTEVNFGAHVLSTARSLLGSTLFGILMTVGLHWYKGMIVGLAIQTIMSPLNLTENPLVKALILGNGIKAEDKIFDEKTASELTAEDEVVDGSGNPVARAPGGGTITGGTGSFEDLMLDTWDAGNKADVGAFMAAVTKKNCNSRSKESGWTPMMILSGLNAKGTASAIRQLKELGGNPAIVDVEGWNSLHWAAFHGSIEAAKELVKDTALLTVKDKEGKLPLDMAKAEGNEDVAKFLEICTETAVTSAKSKADAGLRKRK